MIEVGELVEALFVSGLSTRRITRIFEVLYQMKMSPQQVSRLSKVADDEVEKWRKRRLKDRYPVILIDATFFPVRRGGIEKEPVYIALGIREDGRREILGYWQYKGVESSIIWGEILSELKERGVKGVRLFVGDGVRGLKEQIKRVFPGSRFQFCILHAVKRTLVKVRIRDRRMVAEDLKKIYKAVNSEGAKMALNYFRSRWVKSYPGIVKWWEEHFEDLTEFFKFPQEVRKMIYTTNQLERLMKELKRRLKVMEILPDEENSKKLLYLIFRNLNDKYLSRKLRGFEEAMEEFWDLKGYSLMVREVNLETQLS
jgi:transposase-like protein